MLIPVCDWEKPEGGSVNITTISQIERLMISFLFEASFKRNRRNSQGTTSSWLHVVTGILAGGKPLVLIA